MVKRQHVDTASRVCHYHHDFILTAHRRNAQHSPMVFNTRACWTPWKSQHADVGFSAKDRHTLLDEYHHRPSEWECWQHQLSAIVHRAPTLDDALVQLHRTTKAKLGMLAPTRPATVPSLHQDPIWQTGIANMWAHYRMMKGQHGSGLRSIWRAWHHLARFRRASRRFKAEAKQRRKQLVDAFLAEAHGCALQGDTCQWYKRIRHLCPKAKLDGIHLRSASGELLSTEQSIQELLCTMHSSSMIQTICLHRCLPCLACRLP